jgi:hypothetical protein
MRVFSAVATVVCDGLGEPTVIVEMGGTKSLRGGYDGNGKTRLQLTAF